MRILWLADALRAEGLRVVETEGWRSRGTDALASPLTGVMFHHTATPIGVPDSSPLRVVTFGREGLAGPIANVMVGRDGTAYVIASGRANHAGEGGPWRTIPANTGNLANSLLFGLEVVNNGTGEPWKEVVLSAVDKVFAAVLKKLGKDETWCLGHKEWAPHRKIDPSLDMGQYRLRLGRALEGDDMTPEQEEIVRDARAMRNAFEDFLEGRTPPADSRVARRRTFKALKELEDRAKEAAKTPLPSDHDHDELVRKGTTVTIG